MLSNTIHVHCTFTHESARNYTRSIIHIVDETNLFLLVHLYALSASLYCYTLAGLTTYMYMQVHVRLLHTTAGQNAIYNVFYIILFDLTY